MDYSGLIALALYLIALVLFIRHEATSEEVEEEEIKEEQEVKHEQPSFLDLQDEDATVASLIAAIECRNEYHKNVQVVSVRRIG